MGPVPHAAVLVALAGGLVNLDRRTSLRLMISQPIVSGFIVGVFLGEPGWGFLFGSVFQMVLLGVVSIRGSMLPDFSTGSVIGAAVFVSVMRASAGDPSAEGFAYLLSFTSAFAFSVIFGGLYRWWERRASFLVDVSMSLVESGKEWGVSVVHLSTVVLHFVAGACYTGLLARIMMNAVAGAVHIGGVELFGPLDSLEVMLPFIGLGFLLGHFPSRAKIFWFATGFVVTAVLMISL